MSGTVTHELGQCLNRQIRPYFDCSYIILSGDGLLTKLHDIILQRNQVLTSLDMKSLFTNVLASRHHDIATAYNHYLFPPPP